MFEHPNSAFVEYLWIVEDYLEGRISAETIVKRYQTAYKADKRHQNPDQFEVLNGVFICLENFESDPEIRRRGIGLINEETMRAELEGLYARMKEWE
jgi:hypothetical protein